jgi:hypothetical protein
VLVSLAVTIVLGATSMSDIALLAHQAAIFGDPPSDSTVRRTLDSLDTTALARIAKARAKGPPPCLGPARSTPGRIPLAERGRQAALRVGRDRPGRHPDHRTL